MAIHEIPLTIGERRLALEARAWRLRLPFGGLVWSAPAAVRYGAPDGERRVPIRDVTRLAQLALYGFAFICLAAGLGIRGRQPRESAQHGQE